MRFPAFMGVDFSGAEDMTRVVWMRGKQIASRETVARCRVCGEAKCDHSDLAFAGIVPPAGLLS